MFPVPDTDHWRFERKFFIEHSNRQAIQSLIMFHPAMFSEIYHQRFVNNIYLDTFAMTHYFDNLFGKDMRAKVRIRWYDQLLGYVRQPVLEIKIKNGLLNHKLSFPLHPLTINNQLSIGVVRNALLTADIPPLIKLHIADLTFSVMNRYSRTYYRSADRTFRLTIDTGLEFINVTPLANSFMNTSSDRTAVILELKYDNEHDQRAESITRHFPFRLTRSSKYARGVELLYA